MQTAPYFSAIGLLTIFHALRVIKLRRKHRIGLGHGDNEELERFVRIFGNHAEFAPLGLVLLAALEFVQTPAWYLHLTGISLVLGRVLHAMGLMQTRGASPGRFMGMILTFASLIFASVGVLIFSLHV